MAVAGPSLFVAFFPLFFFTADAFAVASLPLFSAVAFFPADAFAVALFPADAFAVAFFAVVFFFMVALSPLPRASFAADVFAVAFFPLCFVAVCFPPIFFTADSFAAAFAPADLFAVAFFPLSFAAEFLPLFFAAFSADFFAVAFFSLFFAVFAVVFFPLLFAADFLAGPSALACFAPAVVDPRVDDAPVAVAGAARRFAVRGWVVLEFARFVLAMSLLLERARSCPIFGRRGTPKRTLAQGAAGTSGSPPWIRRISTPSRSAEAPP
ncbi:MAG: hypothetical protein R3A79_16070 [Nannocystaceae bacterium]